MAVIFDEVQGEISPPAPAPQTPQAPRDTARPFMQAQQWRQQQLRERRRAARLTDR